MNALTGYDREKHVRANKKLMPKLGANSDFVIDSLNIPEGTNNPFAANVSFEFSMIEYSRA